MHLLEVAAPATGVFSLSWLLIVIPGLVAALLLVLGRAANAWGHYLATLAPIASFVLAVAMFAQLLSAAPDHRSFDLHLFDWISSGTFDAPSCPF